MQATLRHWQNRRMKLIGSEKNFNIEVKNQVVVKSGGGKSSIRCHNCGKVGHKARKCYVKVAPRINKPMGQQQQSDSGGGKNSNSNNNNSSGKKDVRVCYNCGQSGHIATYCMVTV